MAGVGVEVGTGPVAGPVHPARRTAAIHAMARTDTRMVRVDMMGSPVLSSSYGARFYINLP
jgi:hypothetical protein